MTLDLEIYNNNKKTRFKSLINVFKKIILATLIILIFLIFFEENDYKEYYYNKYNCIKSK